MIFHFWNFRKVRINSLIQINSHFSKVPKINVCFLNKNIARNERNPFWTTSKILGLKSLRFSQPLTRGLRKGAGASGTRSADSGTRLRERSCGGCFCNLSIELCVQPSWRLRNCAGLAGTRSDDHRTYLRKRPPRTDSASQGGS